jgi:hypothetical protein
MSNEDLMKVVKKKSSKDPRKLAIIRKEISKTTISNNFNTFYFMQIQFQKHI